MTLLFGGVEQTLSTLARLLGVEEEALRTMLTQRVIATRGEIFTIQVGLDDASLVRDAIVKSLYEVREKGADRIGLGMRRDACVLRSGVRNTKTYVDRVAALYVDDAPVRRCWFLSMCRGYPM